MNASMTLARGARSPVARFCLGAALCILNPLASHADDEALALKFAPVLVLTQNPEKPSYKVLNPEPVEIIGANSIANLQVRAHTFDGGFYYKGPIVSSPSLIRDFFPATVSFASNQFAFLNAYGLTKFGRALPDGTFVPSHLMSVYWDYPGHGKESWDAAYFPGSAEDNSHAGERFSNTIYARVFNRETPSDGYGAAVIKYFAFFPYNDWRNNHEGDWQKINVMVTSTDTSIAQFYGIDYMFHGKSISYYSNRDEVASAFSATDVRNKITLIDGTHPVAYVSAGGHGHYPTPGNFEDAGLLTDDILTSQGVVLHPEIADSHTDIAQSYDLVLLPTPNRSLANMGLSPGMSWLGANVHWGQPKVSSPGSQVPFYEDGNDAPEGPFHRNWDDIRFDNPGHTRYSKSNIPADYQVFHHFPIVGEVSWSGTVSLRGDIVVFPGAVLALAPGTIVEFDPRKDIHEFPAESLGLDDRAEIFVYGTLNASNQANPIQFRKKSTSTWSGTHAWGGIRIMPSGSADLEHAQIRDMSPPPLPPTQVTAEAGNGQVTLRWSDPVVEDPTITGWEYFRRQGNGTPGDWSTGTWRPISSSGSLTAESPALDHGVFHRFQVRAVNAGGKGPASEGLVKIPLMKVAYSAASYDVIERDLSLDERGSSLDVTVRLTPVTDRVVEIPIVIGTSSQLVPPEGFTPAETGDYGVGGLSSSKLRFEPGDNSRRFTITGNSDTDADGEYAWLSFGSLPTGVQAGAQSVATLKIHEPSTTVSPGAVPRKPTKDDDALSATGRINGEILVDWATVPATPDVSGYTLRYQTKLGGRVRSLSTWSEWNICPLLPEVTADTEFPHTGVNALMKYRYQLQASNLRGDSDWSVSFPENGVSPRADVPTGVGIRSLGGGEPSLDQFELIMDCINPLCPDQGQTVSSDDLAQSRFIERQDKSGSGVWRGWDSGGSGASETSGASGASGTSGPRQPVSSPITFSNRVAAVDDSRSILSTYGLSNLDTTMVHQIRVRLVNADDVPGEASDSVAVVPLRARRGDGQVTLEWDNPGNDLVEEWQYRLTPYDGVWEAWQDVAGSDSSTATCTVANLTNGVAYRFQVQGVYETAAMDSRAAVASFTRQATPAGVPEAPGSLSASTAGDWVTLAWTRAPDNGSPLTGYEYRHSTDGGTTWVPDWGAIADSDSTTTSHTLESLRTGTEYTFELRAVNAEGAGDSSRVTATPAWSGSLSESTTWTDTVYVNGDVTVASGDTLTLAQATEVRFVDGADVTAGGTDMGLSEVIVAAGGVLEAGAGQITFRPAGDPPSSPAWYGVRAEGKAVLTGASLRAGKRCAGVEGSGTLVLGRTRFGDCGLVSGSRLVSFAENGTDTVAAYQAVAPLPASVQWSLTGSDSADFSIDTRGWLRFGSPPDYEAAVDEDGDNEYRVTVQARASTDTATLAVVVRVTDVPREDLLSGPGAVDYAENDTALVGRYTAAPAQGATVTWPPLIGDDAGRFRLGGSAAATRLLRFLTPPDYEAPVDADRDSVYQVKVLATDGTHPDTVAVAVRVTNVNEAPPVRGATDTTFAENGTGTVATYTATDPEGEPVGWSLIGTDADTLRLDASGRLTFRAPPDYEAPGDQGDDNRYDVKVVASDGSLPDTLAVAVTVTDVNEPGSITITPASPRVGETLTATLTDEDGVSGVAPFLWRAVGTGVRSHEPRESETETYAAWAGAVGQQIEASTSYSDRHGGGQRARGRTAGVVRPNVPGAPGDLRASAGVRQVALRWTAADSNGAWITSYEYQRSTDGGRTWWRPGWTGISGSGAGTTSYTETELSSDTTYTFQVRAGNRVGRGPASNPASARPRDCTLSLAGSGSVDYAENGTAAVGTYTATASHCESLSWSLSGPDSLAFELQRPGPSIPARLLRFKSSPDYEAKASYRVTVEVAAGTRSASRAVTVNVTDVNEPPVISGPASPSVPEDSTRVATYTATDPEGHTVRWSVATGGGTFGIGRSSGALTFKSAKDYEALSSYTYTVTIRATDTGSPPADTTHTVTVTVTNTDEPGTVVFSPNPPKVGQPVTAAVEDPDRGVTRPRNWNWSRVDAPRGARAPLSTTAEYTPTSQDVDYRLRATVTYDDAQGSDKSAAGNSGPVPPPPCSLSLSGSASVNYAENGTGSVGTYKATASYCGSLSWTLSGTDASAFQLSGTGSSRSLQFRSAPDYEAPTDRAAPGIPTEAGNNVYKVTVKVTAASPGSPSDTEDVTVTVTNVNEPGRVTLSSSRPYVGDQVTATLTDEDGGIAGATWSWTTVNPVSRSAPPPTSTQSYRYTVPSSAAGQLLRASVSYSDAHGSGQSAATTSTGTVRRRPCSLLLSGSGSVNYAENGRGSVGTYTASATNCGTLSWTLEGTDSGDFQLSGTGSSRSLQFRSSPNYESPADANTNNVYSVTVKATDNGSPARSATKSVTVTVTNVNERPTISGSSSKSVAENGTTVASYTASDPESGSISWSLSGTDDDDFSISSSGALRFASAPDYENPSDSNTNNLYVVTVRATDDGSPARTATKSVRVTVTNVNERPTISGSSSKSVAENGTTVASYTASDPESGSISWSLSGTDDDDFSISSSGALRFASAPDYENPSDSNTNNLYVVTVRATDNGSPARTATKSVRVTVTNADEAGSISLTTTSPQVGRVMTASLSDPDGGISNTSWQWQASNTSPAIWNNRGTSFRYTPGRSDVGYVLRATASYTDAHGSGKSAQSSATSEVRGPTRSLSKPVALADTPDSVLAVVSAPNPFNPSTTLHLQLPEAGPVSLIVYNMAGQVVATLLYDHYLPAGLHARVWEGRDDHGREAASGLYLYRLTAGRQGLVGKLALIR